MPGSPYLVIVVAIILMLGGLVALSSTLAGGVPGALARFGRVAAVAGATVGMVLVILDGVAKQLAEEWAAARREKRPWPFVSSAPTRPSTSP